MTRAVNTKKATKKSKPVSKTIAKATPAKKTSKTVTKTPVAPKKVESVKTKKANERTAAADKDQTLDLCLLMDCTSSMSSWIVRSKDTLKEIIDAVKIQNPGLNVRVAFVGYRDIKDSERFRIQELTDDIELVKNFISKTEASGGADMPEDVQGGLNKALNLSWMDHSIKQAFMICDAPGHGEDINGFKGFFGDDYPNGSPDGFKIQEQMKTFAAKNINFTIVKVNDSCDTMIKVMQANYDNHNRTMNVSDLAHAV